MSLVQARIEVIEDLDRHLWHDTDIVPTVTASVQGDPRIAGRERLRRDRLHAPRRLARILLTPEEEVGLTLLARPDGAALEAGGFAALSGEQREAAEAMVLHNMGLIHSVARRHQGRGLDYEDLVAHGMPGLIRAIEMFDCTLGLKFSTYAMNWIRQSIGRGVDQDGRLVRLPVHVCEAIRQVKAAEERLIRQGNRPTRIAIAQECRLDVAKVEELLRLAPAVVSLDKPVGNDGVTLGDLLDKPVAETDVEVYGLTSDDLRDVLDLLVEREADILKRRHGVFPYDECQTLDDIGRVYGVTRERIRQIEKSALTRMRGLLGVSERVTASA